MSDGLLDTAGQQLQEVRGPVQPRGQKQVGRARSATGMSLLEQIGGLSAWLAFRSWVLIPKVVAVGTWAWALSRHSWIPWPQTQVEIIP